MADDNRDEKKEVEALCPDCGTGFMAYIDRIMPDVHNTHGKIQARCPECGCRDCVIK